MIVGASVAVAVAIASAFGAFGGGGSASKSPTAAAVRPRIPPGVMLHQKAVALENRVRRRLGPHSVITSVLVVAHRRETSRLIGGTGPEIENGGPAWIIHARGLFAPVTNPPGGSFHVRQRNGYVVIDDKTGHTLAYGFGG